MEFRSMFMVSLANLRHIAGTEKGISPPALARTIGLPGLDADRMAALYSKNDHRRPEPWLWEAYAIAAALGMSEIMPLIGGWTAAELAPSIDEEIQDDISIWRSGCDLPLRLAIRITVCLGLRDPADLFRLTMLRSMPALPEPSAMIVEVWSIVASGERSGSPGRCPWCAADLVGGAAHLSTCLPNDLWGARDLADVFRGVEPPEPRVPGKRQNGKGTVAPGLRFCRTREGLTQDDMARTLGIGYAHYTKVENCKANFTPELAAVLRQRFPRITMADIFSAPTVEREASLEGAPPPVVLA